MKTWKNPVAVAQQFAANEYVSACYRVRCITPNNDDYTWGIYADNDKDGVYNPDIDSVVWESKTHAVTGCRGYHEVTGQAAPDANGICRQANQTYYPIFYWYGDVIDQVEGNYNFIDLHFTDLSRDDAVIYDGNHS